MHKAILSLKEDEILVQGPIEFWEINFYKDAIAEKNNYLSNHIVALINPQFNNEVTPVVHYNLHSKEIIEIEELQDSFSISINLLDDQNRITEIRAKALAPLLFEHHWVKQTIEQFGFRKDLSYCNSFISDDGKKGSYEFIKAYEEAKAELIPTTNNDFKWRKAHIHNHKSNMINVTAYKLLNEQKFLTPEETAIILDIEPENMEGIGYKLDLDTISKLEAFIQRPILVTPYEYIDYCIHHFLEFEQLYVKMKKCFEVYNKHKESLLKSDKIISIDYFVKYPKKNKNQLDFNFYILIETKNYEDDSILKELEGIKIFTTWTNPECVLSATVKENKYPYL